LIQDSYVSWLRQLGQSWTPSATRAQLPTQGVHIDYVITAVNATATSNASTAHMVMDGYSDGGFADHYTQSLWSSSGSLPQSVTVDLGAAYYNIEICDYLPKQIARQDAIGFDSSAIITKYAISYSLDNTTFTPVTLNTGYDGAWVADNTLKYALFAPVHARYMRLTISAVRSGSVATISELDFGGYTLKPSLSPETKIQRNMIMPSLKSDVPNTRLSTMLNGVNTYSNAGLADAIRTGNSIVYYSMDGRKLFQSGNGHVPVFPVPFSSKALIIQEK